MLQKVLFEGYHVSKSTFEAHSDPAEKGFFELKIGFPDAVEIVKALDEGLLRIPAQIQLDAYAKDTPSDEAEGEERECLFNCEIQAELQFSGVPDELKDEAVLEEHKWHFENYLQLIASELLMKLLSNTHYKSIVIPPHRKI